MMDFLEALITCINNRDSIGMNMDLRFLEQTKIVPLSVGKVGADDFLTFGVNNELTFDGVSFFLARVEVSLLFFSVVRLGFQKHQPKSLHTACHF